MNICESTLFHLYYNCNIAINITYNKCIKILNKTELMYVIYYMIEEVITSRKSNWEYYSI